MKKVFFFAVMAFTLFLVASCSKHEVPEVTPSCPDGYYVEVVQAVCPPTTKASVDEVSGKVSWTNGDIIAFHLSNGTYLNAEVDPVTGKARLVLVASDASDHTLRKTQNLVAGTKQPLLKVPYDKDTLGNTVGYSAIRPWRRDAGQPDRSQRSRVADAGS